MALSRNTILLLEECGKLMAQGTVDFGLNLSPISREFGHSGEDMVAVIAAAAESASNGSRTVRQCDVAFFGALIQGPNLYLVACNSTVPSGKVTELTDDMILYCVGPYSNGFTIEKRASEELVEKSRASALVSQRRREQRLQGEQLSEELLAKLLIAVRFRAQMARPVQRGDADYALPSQLSSRPSPPTLEQIAQACVALGVTLDDLIEDVIS